MLRSGGATLPGNFFKLHTLDPGSTTSYGCYDPMGRAWTSTQTLGSYSYPFSYTYKYTGALATETYPSFSSVQGLSGPPKESYRRSYCLFL